MESASGNNSSWFIVLLLISSCMVLPSCDWFGTKENAPLAKTAMQGKAIVINVLDKDTYENAHIKGSINVPFDTLEQWATTVSDKSVPIVVYCANYMCPASAEAAKLLTSLGFSNVSAYEGGIAEWHYLSKTQPAKYPTEGAATASFLEEYQKPEGHSASDVKTVTADELTLILESHS